MTPAYPPGLCGIRASVRVVVAGGSATIIVGDAGLIWVISPALPVLLLIFFQSILADN